MSEMPENVRTALERHLIEYCYAVDGLEDVGPLMVLFTDDAVADFSAIGLPAMTGREEIGAFYKAVFADMTHHFHFISNFRPDGWDADEGAGAMTAYVIGMGAAKDGSSITVNSPSAARSRPSPPCIRSQASRPAIWAGPSTIGSTSALTSPRVSASCTGS